MDDQRAACPELQTGGERLSFVLVPCEIVSVAHLKPALLDQNVGFPFTRVSVAEVVQMAHIARFEAEQIAANHVSHTSSGHPDYRVGCRLLGQAGDDWLFEYEIHCLKNVPVEQQVQFAGAGGFLVSPCGRVSSISVPELIEFEQRLGESVGGK